MSEKFNPKEYLGKGRIYRGVKGFSGIYRTYVWNGSQYVDPTKGDRYLVRKSVLQTDGSTKRIAQQFDDLELARCWKDGVEPARSSNQNTMSLEALIEASAKSTTYRFGDIMDDFSKRHLPNVSISTARKYSKQLDLHFGALREVPMDKFAPVVVDKWIEKLKESPSGKSKKRKDFKHELSLLSTIFKFFREYYDEMAQWQSPLRERHDLAADLKKGPKRAVPYLKREEFFYFREKLFSQKHGGLLGILATVQYFQALRVSEAAALAGEDFQINWNDFPKSRVVVQNAVKWKKDTGRETALGQLKNADHIGGSKEQPLFPETFEALKMLHDFKNRKGLLFTDRGTLFEFRQIEGAYNSAFGLAGLPYRGTHIMRHGGCRDVYNSTSGDLEVAKQHLGNSSVKSTLVYAQREASALTKVAEERWAKAAGDVIETPSNVFILSANVSKAASVSKEDLEP